MHEMYAHDLREEEWNVAWCDNHIPWDEFEDGELMDIHAVSVGDWTNPYFAVCTDVGVFCSRECAKEFANA
jgi:hypothetical protein